MTPGRHAKPDSGARHACGQRKGEADPAEAHERTAGQRWKHSKRGFMACTLDPVEHGSTRRAKALRDAPSGRQTGDGRLLDAAQEAAVQKLITDKTPDQLKMPYALWTRMAVAELIKQRFGIRLPVRTMGCTWRAGASRRKSR
jgi:hypothetical protein